MCSSSGAASVRNCVHSVIQSRATDAISHPPLNLVQFYHDSLLFEGVAAIKQPKAGTRRSEEGATGGIATGGIATDGIATGGIATGPETTTDATDGAARTCLSVSGHRGQPPARMQPRPNYHNCVRTLRDGEGRHRRNSNTHALRVSE